MHMRVLVSNTTYYAYNAGNPRRTILDHRRRRGTGMVRGPQGSRGRGRGTGRSSAASSGATNFLREHQKLIFGPEFMLHRRHVDDRWVACEPRDAGHETDSGVHRYDRVHGFAVTDEELAMMRRNPVIAAAERRSRQADKQACKQDSHVQSVGRWKTPSSRCGSSRG